MMKDRPRSPGIVLPTETLVANLADRLLSLQWRLVTAESCTGGLVAAACTDRAGSSDWFERGLVTYSNAAKQELLGVDARLIEQHGAVSQEVAGAMATGAVRHGAASCSIAVTGVAGPGGGSVSKPVGTVWFGWCVGGRVDTERCLFGGDRLAVRTASVAHALAGLLMRLPLAAATPR